MRESNALKKEIIGELEIQELIVKRETYQSLKKRLADIEGEMKAIEKGIINKIECGALVESDRNLKITSVERRYPG